MLEVRKWCVYIFIFNLMGSSHFSEIRHVGNGTHGESFMDQTVVDKHVGHAKNRNSKTLQQSMEWSTMLIREMHRVILVTKKRLLIIPMN